MGTVVNLTCLFLFSNVRGLEVTPTVSFRLNLENGVELELELRFMI